MIRSDLGAAGRLALLLRGPGRLAQVPSEEGESEGETGNLWIGLWEACELRAEGFCFLVVPGEEGVVVVDGPDAIIDFLKADDLARERVGEKDLAFLDAEAAAVRDTPQLEVAGILRSLDAVWKRARRGLPARGRRVVVERLVGALLVVRGAKPIEDLLLKT